ncbi:MAG: lytic transglycosylase domain-containing protein [Campylobacteraceae bacterium]|nr:lytic transglycosylase domain-containing protein [Campylobacteraceae bacterium]
MNFKDYENYPRSLAKDYYIYRYLTEQNPTPKEASTLFFQTQTLSPTLLQAFGKKLEDQGLNHAIKCLNLAQAQFWEVDDNCQAIRISPSLFVTFSLKQRKFLYKKLNSLFPNYFEWMPVLLEENPLEKALKSPDFIYLYTNVGLDFRLKNFNSLISLEVLEELSKKSNFETFVNKVILEGVHDKIEISLLSLNPSSISATSYTAFLLGLNALMHENPNLAVDWFELSIQKSYYQSDKDKALFWQYLATKNDEYLKTIAKSWDFNIYSIAAKEYLNEEPFELIVPNPVENKRENYSITDPFTWNETLKFLQNRSLLALEKIASSFFTKTTLPHYSFIKERANSYKSHYFAIPYEDLLEKISVDRKALILAISRQESRFIPASISTSFALGMTQFMPFLARHIAKEQKIENFDLDHMFSPSTAYRFADIHLDYLSSWLYHPLLVAYAYNGGIGFTKRMLLEGNLFKKEKYEPFLSMELVAYAESREYGKKVLANYVAYKKILKEEVLIWDLFETLKSPDESHRF